VLEVVVFLGGRGNPVCLTWPGGEVGKHPRTEEATRRQLKKWKESWDEGICERNKGSRVVCRIDDQERSKFTASIRQL